MLRHVLGFFVLAFTLGCAAGDTNFLGRLVVGDTTASVTCVTASGRASVCADGDLEANDDLDVGDDATIRDALAVTGAATVGTTLQVTGASTLASVGVTGAATVGTTLNVTGASTLASVGVTGAATVGTTLQVTGASTLASVVVTAGATVGTTLAVTGAISGLRTLDTKTATYTVSAPTDCGAVFLDATDNGTLTLPDAAAGNKGCQVTLVNSAASTAALVCFSPHSSDGIFGSVALVAANGTANSDWCNTKNASVKGDYTTLVSDGATGWWIVGGIGVWANVGP